MAIPRREQVHREAAQTTKAGLLANLLLAIGKATAGVLGNSFALIADAIESSLDVFGSILILLGLRVAAQPPTEKHPYGRGRAETLAAGAVSIALYIAAAWIAVESVRAMMEPPVVPKPFTLAVLLGILVLKEGLFRFTSKVGDNLAVAAVKADAWHHRSDALTSLAALIGIVLALLGGPAFGHADKWAALAAAGVIAYNATALLRSALEELTDREPDKAIADKVRAVAVSVDGVEGTHRCWIRKQGFDLFVDLDVLVDGKVSVKEGHDIAHTVQLRVKEALPLVARVMIHVEPSDEYGRHPMAWEQKLPLDHD